ncbi:Retinol dehydrogenase 11 [Phlyctema vagabunda]|uniref:Retinol dehydrogenase 11 n=1 Tax=Phlyctema vagabunda TaxID=108571 RepID=A0ABR4PIZ9_9HELO
MDLIATIYSQFKWLPYPDTDCTGRTIIVVGANVGLGKEAARHFVRLNASKVILAVRSLARGEAAKQEIGKTTKRPDAMEVWEVDLASYPSVIAFVSRVSQLPRVDAVIANASIATRNFELAEDGENEQTIAINVIGTFLLVLLLLPVLEGVAKKWDISPIMTIVSSDIHIFAQFPERSASNILDTMNDPKTARMEDRYPASKLLQVFAFREIITRSAKKSPRVVINMLNPGLCKTELARNATGLVHVQMVIFKALVARSAEVGSRTLVHAATIGVESHGRYMSDCDVNKNTLSSFVTSMEGKRAQEKFWDELVRKLEKIEPEIMRVLE